MGYLVGIDNGNTAACQLVKTGISQRIDVTYRVSLSDMLAFAECGEGLLQEGRKSKLAGFLETKCVGGCDSANSSA